MKSHSHIIRLTFTALFSAIIMLATMIYIPLGGGGGYLNPGDSMIYSAAWFLGPMAAAAAAIGSALADLILGYAIYAPATFIIKGLMGLLVGFLIKRGNKNFLRKILAMSVGAIIMVSGYFVYDYFVLGLGNAAIASILWNLVQGAAGVIIGSLVIGALVNIKGIKGFVDRLEEK